MLKIGSQLFLSFKIFAGTPFVRNMILLSNCPYEFFSIDLGESTWPGDGARNTCISWMWMSTSLEKLVKFSWPISSNIFFKLLLFQDCQWVRFGLFTKSHIYQKFCLFLNFLNFFWLIWFKELIFELWVSFLIRSVLLLTLLIVL